MRSGRLKALVLLVALMGGGFVLPLYDAIAFHSHPSAAPADTDVLAAPGTDVGHAQVCALSHARAPARFGPGPLAALPDPFVHTIRAKVRVAALLLERLTSYEHRSRAPPSLA